MTITKPSGNNIGGIAQLYYAFQRDLTSLFDFDYELDDLQITQANFDSNFTRLNHKIRSAGYDFTKQPTDGDDEYNNSIEAEFLKLRPEVIDYLASTSNTKLCFIFKSHNADWWILPFCTESAAGKMGREPKDTNNIIITWTSQLTYTAKPITIT